MMIQKFSKLLFMMLAFTAILTSCGEDTGDGGSTGTTAKVAFGGTTGADAKVKPCDPITMTIVATKGTDEMSAIEVLEDGAKVAIDRITWKGAAAGGNPILLIGADKSSFTGDLIVKASCTIGAKVITVNVIDAKNTKVAVNKKVTTEAISPTSKYNGPAVVEASANTFNIFKFDVTKGTGIITTVEVQENSQKMTDLTRLQFDGKPFTANPEALAAAFQGGFTDKGVWVKTPTAPNTYKYTFIFKDEFGLATQHEVNVKVGVPTTFMKIGALFNQAGPAGTGGLDLDDAVGTGSTSTLAEVADLGIDVTKPVASNWKQEIIGVNGTTLKILKRAAEVEATWVLSSITLVDQISALYAKGKDIATGQKIVKGDIIVAKKDTKYYIFEVTDVILTAADNEDKYQVDIKW